MNHSAWRMKFGVARDQQLSPIFVSVEYFFFVFNCLKYDTGSKILTNKLKITGILTTRKEENKLVADFAVYSL